MPWKPTSYAAVGSSRAVCHACCARLLSPGAVCTQQMITQGIDSLAAPAQPAAAPVPHARRQTVCHGPLPTVEAALGLQLAASAVSLGSSSVRCRQKMEGITRSSSRAAASVAIRHAAPCAIAPSDRLPSEQIGYAAVSASQAVMDAAPDYYLRAPCAPCK